MLLARIWIPIAEARTEDNRDDRHPWDHPMLEPQNGAHPQTFDLVRQILEHRITEADQIHAKLEVLRKGESPWTDMKEELFTQIAKTLVTDQEKLSYEFFLPEGFRRLANEERHDPGDVLLF